MGRNGVAFQWWGWAGYQVFAPFSLVRISYVVTICMTGARRTATGGTNGVSEPARTLVRCKGGHSLEPVHRAGDE
ncbi:hypothetical protein CSN78_004010 [Salmonella enterica subsp. diarizonae]|nr:hypothetical protein LFZ55_24745 [Salmonella enterica subsp. diarizonae serovar 65:c:z str. SA20044251]EDT8786363.1 hypothetical protein [Salmonella enterica subsp. diarizonae]